MKLITDWKRAHRYLSTQAMLLAAGVQGAWVAIPDDLRSSVPHWIPQGVTGVLLAAGIVGRVIDQTPPTPQPVNVPPPNPDNSEHA